MVVRSFEPLLYGNDGEAARALPAEEGLPFDEFTGRSCLGLIDRLTGVQIERELLAAPQLTYWRPVEGF